MHHSMGSVANVNLLDLPEMRRARPIINYWAEELLFSLSTWRPYFLDNLVQMTSLAFLLSTRRSQAQGYMGRIPCVQQGPKDVYLRPDGKNVVHDILTLLDGAGKRPIVAGILFLRYASSSCSALIIAVH